MSTHVTLDEAREQFQALPNIPAARTYLQAAIDYEERGIVLFPVLRDATIEIATWLNQKGMYLP